MKSMTGKRKPRETYADDTSRWQAVLRRDARADGRFVYSVKTTGIYCRPGCAAKLARREHVQFHLTAADAEKAGFRPCKRCKPQEATANRKPAEKVARACQLIVEAEDLPRLGDLAAAVGLSASHFHRVFRSLTGVTPRSYAAAHRTQRVRKQLGRRDTVTSAIYRAGYNSNARFYAAAAGILGMTPSAFRAGGKGVRIRFAVGQCSLGTILVAATKVGICSIAMGDDPESLVRGLQAQFPEADLVGADREFEQWVAKVVGFVDRPALGLDLPLDVRGTAFQQRVWEKLREIPCGQTRSYSALARELGMPRAVRAVAGACAANQIAVAIPCHRVVRLDGSLSGYRWGVARKRKLLKAEKWR